MSYLIEDESAKLTRESRRSTESAPAKRLSIRAMDKRYKLSGDSDIAIYVQLDDDGKAATGKQLILERFPDKATEFDWKLKSAG